MPGNNSVPRVRDHEVAEALLTLIVAHLPQVVDRAQVALETNLYELGLDSTAAIALMLAIEDKFGVSFPDSLVDETSFETPKALKEVISSLLA